MMMKKIMMGCGIALAIVCILLVIILPIVLWI